MLLALDAGNSNITIGAFEGTKLIERWRLRTIHEQTADEWGVLMRNLFALASLDLARVDGIIIASVVPTLEAPLLAMAQRYFHATPLFVTPDTDIGLKVLYDNPREVGADRVVNGVAAFHRYGGPSVVVDLGTTINFDVVSANAEYLGGMICPGIGMSISGLFAKTARLPMVDLREPERLIGKNTVNSIQSGLYYGFAGLIDGIVGRLVAELGGKAKVIATGGQAQLIARACALRSRDQRRPDAGRPGNHMAAQSEEVAPRDPDNDANWPSNYFNYFTEVEERFQKARGTGLFLMSPLDWALVEAWKNAGVPLEAVLRGVDAAFDKWRAKKKRGQNVNSVAYCSQAVMLEAQAMAGVAPSPASRKESSAPFTLEALQGYLAANAQQIRSREGLEEVAAAVEHLASDASALYHDLENLERRLTALEDKMIALVRSRQTEEQLFQVRRELDLQLRPYRGKMTTPQLAMLEKQYLERQLLDSAGLPRLSLFYLR